MHKFISHEDAQKLCAYFSNPVSHRDNRRNAKSYFEFKHQRIALVFGAIGISLIVTSAFLNGEWEGIYSTHYNHGIIFWIGCIILIIALEFYGNVFSRVSNWIKSGK